MSSRTSDLPDVAATIVGTDRVPVVVDGVTSTIAVDDLTRVPRIGELPWAAGAETAAAKSAKNSSIIGGRITAGTDAPSAGTGANDGCSMIVGDWDGTSVQTGHGGSVFGTGTNGTMEAAYQGTVAHGSVNAQPGNNGASIVAYSPGSFAGGYISVEDNFAAALVDKGLLTAKDITDAVVAEPVDEEVVKP